MKILTLGGAISGNCATGDVFIANNPKKTIATDKAMARTGLLINLLNMLSYLEVPALFSVYIF
jgi:hypothetical protein